MHKVGPAASKLQQEISKTQTEGRSADAAGRSCLTGVALLPSGLGMGL